MTAQVLRAFDTHCPWRSMSAGDQAPAAKTTRSANHFVPSSASTPIQTLPSAESKGSLNVPELMKG